MGIRFSMVRGLGLLVVVYAAVVKVVVVCAF